METIVIRTGLQELQRQLKFRETMLARRKVRVAERLLEDETAIERLEARISELEASK
jgi:Arc/MetJ-type ribon-helix-helix transcriptional regulator